MNTQSILRVNHKDARVAMAHMYVVFLALAVGGLMGLLQVFVRSGRFELPANIGYYQVLTVHGVMLGLVLTTFFIMGFQYAVVSRTAGAFSANGRLDWLLAYDTWHHDGRYDDFT